jgi:hypothetical protein
MRSKLIFLFFVVITLLSACASHGTASGDLPQTLNKQLNDAAPIAQTFCAKATSEDLNQHICNPTCTQCNIDEHCLCLGDGPNRYCYKPLPIELGTPNGHYTFTSAPRVKCIAGPCQWNEYGRQWYTIEVDNPNEKKVVAVLSSYPTTVEVCADALWQ